MSFQAVYSETMQLFRTLADSIKAFALERLLDQGIKSNKVAHQFLWKSIANVQIGSTESSDGLKNGCNTTSWGIQAHRSARAVAYHSPRYSIGQTSDPFLISVAKRKVLRK
jgi:hypothetical protein